MRHYNTNAYLLEVLNLDTHEVFTYEGSITEIRYKTKTKVYTTNAGTTWVSRGYGSHPPFLYRLTDLHEVIEGPCQSHYTYTKPKQHKVTYNDTLTPEEFTALAKDWYRSNFGLSLDEAISMEWCGRDVCEFDLGRYSYPSKGLMSDYKTRIYR